MKLFYLSILSFVFISINAIYLNKLIALNSQNKEEKVLSAYSSSNTLLPVLQSDYLLPSYSAQGIYAMDLNSSVVLFEKSSDTKLSPASTTKLMTAVVSLENYSLEDFVVVPVMHVDGQKMGLVAGEKIKIIDLIKGMLIFSGNDAAEALASVYPGGRNEFINLMNIKARELKMDDTFFKNPAGFDELNHYSTARDMTKIAQYVLNNPILKEIVETKNIEIHDESGKIKHKLTNTNQLLEKVDGVKGIKTGWTENARENLITYVERDNKPIVIALLGSNDRFGETTDLINWIYKYYKWERISFEYNTR